MSAPGTCRRPATHSPPCRCSRRRRPTRSSEWSWDWRGRRSWPRAGTRARRSRRGDHGCRGSTGTEGRRSSSSRGRCRRKDRRRFEVCPPGLMCRADQVADVARVDAERGLNSRGSPAESRMRRQRRSRGSWRLRMLLGKQIVESRACGKAVEERRMVAVADHGVKVLVLEEEEEHVVIARHLQRGAAEAPGAGGASTTKPMRRQRLGHIQLAVRQARRSWSATSPE